MYVWENAEIYGNNGGFQEYMRERNIIPGNIQPLRQSRFFRKILNKIQLFDKIKTRKFLDFRIYNMEDNKNDRKDRI